MPQYRLALRACVAALLAAVAACSDAPTESGLARLSPLGRSPLADVSAAATTTIANQGASGLCLAVSGTGSGTTASLQSCGAGSTQSWNVPAAGTAGSITLSASGQCMDAFGGWSNAGDRIGLWGCSGATNQTFTLASTGELKVANGLCVGPRDGGTAASTAIEIQACTGAATQKWTAGATLNTPTTTLGGALPTSRFSGQLVNAGATGLCLTANVVGAVTGLQNCAGTSMQTWSVPGAGAAAGAMTLAAYGMCADAYGGFMNAGDAVGLWGCSGNGNQTFTLTSAGELKVANGMCVGPKGGTSAAGVTLQLQPCSGAATQKWGTGTSTTTTPTTSTPTPSTPTTTTPTGSTPNARFTGQLSAASASGLCFAVPSTSSGTVAALATCAAGTQNQTWSLPGAGGGAGAVSLIINAQCLDAFGGYLNAGDRVGLWNCLGSTNQAYTLTNGGEFKTSNGMCVGPKGGAAVAGVTLELQTCTGAASQKWVGSAISATPAAPTGFPTVSPTNPTLPAELSLPSDAVVTGRQWRVPVGVSGEDLHVILNSANPGDEILLPAGAEVPNMFLPRRKGPGWITIRTDLSASQIPAPGTRVTPSMAANFAKIVGGRANDPVISAQNGSGGWRFIAVEITNRSDVSVLNTMIALGWGDATSLSETPTDFVFDRTYVHSGPTLDLTRCFLMNASRTAIVNSTLECHGRFTDAMAIGGWAAPGPFRFENNSIAGSGHGIFFGGNDPLIPNVMPSDIVIRNNRIWRPLEWKGVWPAKTLVETKMAQRMLLEGNLFENNWIDAQNGFAILFKSVNQNGLAPWAQTADVTFRRNIVRNVAAAFNLAAAPEPNPAVPATRIKIEQNLVYDVGLVQGETNGRLLQIVGNLTDVQIVNNTMIHTATGGYSAISMDGSGGSMRNLLIANNVMTTAQYGWISAEGLGAAALTGTASSSWSALGNVLVGSGMATLGVLKYPIGNSFAEALSDIGLVNVSGGDYSFSGSSIYRSVGTGGATPGVDMGAVLSATAIATAMR